MIAAHELGVPAPKVRAILDTSDGLGPGYITEFVAGRDARDADSARG